MPTDLWPAIESSFLGAEMRTSVFLYPAANVLHVLSLMVFFAAVAAMDARLLGVWSTLAPSDVIDVCRPLAAGALAVQAVTGASLFSADAVALVDNSAFRLKLLMIVLGLANVGVLQLAYGRSLSRLPAGTAIPAGARAIAAVSLTGWLMTAVLGRLIGYV